MRQNFEKKVRDFVFGYAIGTRSVRDFLGVTH